MPATIRDVITLALKKLTIVQSGGVATAEDAADLLASLSSFYNECIDGGTFGRVFDVPISKAFDGSPGHNQQINVLTDEAVALELPATMPSTWCCNWRPWRDYGWGLSVPADENVPHDLSVVRVTDQFGPSRATYIYDGYIQRWVRVDDLDLTVDSTVLNREAPLSARNMDGLASVLAVRVADQFGQDLLSAITVGSSDRYRRALVTRFGRADTYCAEFH